MSQLKIIGVTGHRKLSHTENNIHTILIKIFTENNVDVVITGMALGFDQFVADICVEKQIPFIAAIPCDNHTIRWNIEQKRRWKNLIEKAWKRTIVSPGPFAVWKLLERNKWIVDRSNHIISYWDGVNKGGTFHCMNYAKTQGKQINNIFTTL